MLGMMHILAQAGTPAPPTAPPVGNPAGSIFIFAMMVAMIGFMFMTRGSQKKREKRAREEMYSAMGRNDRVQTIGGIIGTVLSVKETEVVLKVDESTNTKMTFMKSAIQTVLTEDQGSSS